MMKAVGAFLFAAGCYAPNAPANVPCDPLAPHCPSGQQCIGLPGAAMCGTGLAIDAPLLPLPDAMPRDAPLIDSRMIDGPMIPIDAMPDAMLPPLHIDYPATVADCIDPTLPDTQKCINRNGAGQLVVDANDSTTNNPWQGYVRFDLDGQLAGRTVTAVSLVLVATSDPKASSPETGNVWLVSSFTHLSLSMTVPTKLSMLAGSQGNVIPLQVVTWQLPPTVVGANQPVYLGLITSQQDGVNYWNLTGPKPPVLHVDAD